MLFAPHNSRFCLGPLFCSSAGCIDRFLLTYLRSKVEHWLVNLARSLFVLLLNSFNDMLSQKITTTVQMLVLKTARSNNTIRRCGLFESLHWDSGREFNLQSLINFNKYVSDMTEAEENVARQSLTKMKLKRVSEAGSRRSVRRPEEINRDVRGLKLRQRVSLVLGDEILRDELEGVMKTSENGPKRLNGIRTYQDFLLPTIYPGYYGAGGSATGVVPPINDIRGADTLSYSKAERIWRCKLAAVYRVIDLLGWSDNVFNHISVSIEVPVKRQ